MVVWLFVRLVARYGIWIPVCYLMPKPTNRYMIDIYIIFIYVTFFILAMTQLFADE